MPKSHESNLATFKELLQKSPAPTLSLKYGESEPSNDKKVKKFENVVLLPNLTFYVKQTTP
jgi:hypothetical protein